jgi:hypothetical protein
MKKASMLLLLLTLNVLAGAQQKNTFSGYLFAGANGMAYDRYISFTHVGPGVGLQVGYTINPTLKIQLDAAASSFIINKILFVFPDGQTAGPKQFIFTSFAGIVYAPVKKVEAGLSAGPSFIEGAVYAGFRPYISYYPGKKDRIKALLSLTHIFEKNSISKKNTGFISFGLAVKIF